MPELPLGLVGPLAEALGGGALRALPYVVHGVHAGLSANQIGEALTAGGMGLRRANLLGLVRQIRLGYAAAAYQRGLTANQFASPELYHGSQGFMDNPFAYIVKVTGQNPFTGALAEQHITVSSAVPLTNADLEQYVGDIIDAGYVDYRMEMDHYDLLEVLVDPRFLA